LSDNHRLALPFSFSSPYSLTSLYIARITGQHSFVWQHQSKNNKVIDVKVTLNLSSWHDGKECILVHWKLIEETE